MRTLIIILGGFILLGACILAARRLGGSPAPIGPAVAIFIVAWLAVAAINMWMGVARAGYSFREELPIFLSIFLIPAAAAVLVRWKLS